MTSHALEKKKHHLGGVRHALPSHSLWHGSVRALRANTMRPMMHDHWHKAASQAAERRNFGLPTRGSKPIHLQSGTTHEPHAPSEWDPPHLRIDTSNHHAKSRAQWQTSPQHVPGLRPQRSRNRSEQFQNGQALRRSVPVLQDGSLLRETCSY